MDKNNSVFAYIQDQLCGGDGAAAEWLVAYLAQSVQESKENPRSGVAIVGGDHENVRDFIERVISTIHMPGETVFVSDAGDLNRHASKSLIVFDGSELKAVNQFLFSDRVPEYWVVNENPKIYESRYNVSPKKAPLVYRSARVIALLPPSDEKQSTNRRWTVLKAASNPPAYEWNEDDVNAFGVSMVLPHSVDLGNTYQHEDAA